MTTIVPVRFFPPKTAGWSHNIKAADGFFYGCPEKLITLFQLNQPIEVEVTTKEKNGTTYRDIKRVIPNESAPLPPGQVIHSGNAPAPGAENDPYQKRPTPDKDARRMFVTAFCSAYVRSGHFYESTQLLQGKSDSPVREVLRLAVRAAKSIFDEEIANVS